MLCLYPITRLCQCLRLRVAEAHPSRYRYLQTTSRLHRCCTGILRVAEAHPSRYRYRYRYPTLDTFPSSIPLPSSQHDRMKKRGRREAGARSPQHEDTRNGFEEVVKAPDRIVDAHNHLHNTGAPGIPSRRAERAHYLARYADADHIYMTLVSAPSSPM